jgi:hypothetical protein
MKTALTICVISCLLVVGYAIDLGNIASCTTRQGEVGTCITRLELPSASTDNSFCTDCANSLVGYYQECTNRDDIDSLLEGERQV